jgi:hypothetical protein
MKLVAYPLAVLLGLLGFVFVVGAQGLATRMVVGIILWVAAGALVWLARKMPQTTNIVQKIDLSGDVHLEGMTCRSCGGTLSKKSITVNAGAVFINCEFCNATYQIEEEPKW